MNQYGEAEREDLIKTHISLMRNGEITGTDDGKTLLKVTDECNYAANHYLTALRMIVKLQDENAELRSYVEKANERLKIVYEQLESLRHKAANIPHRLSIP